MDISKRVNECTAEYMDSIRDLDDVLVKLAEQLQVVFLFLQFPKMDYWELNPHCLHKHLCQADLLQKK